MMKLEKTLKIEYEEKNRAHFSKLPYDPKIWKQN